MLEKYFLIYNTFPSGIIKNLDCTEGYDGLGRCKGGTYDLTEVKVYVKCNQSAYTFVVKEIYMNHIVGWYNRTAVVWITQGLFKTLLAGLQEQKKYAVDNMSRMVNEYMLRQIYAKAIGIGKEMINASIEWKGFTYQFIVKERFIRKVSW